MTRTPVQIVQGFIDRQLEAGNSAKHQLLCNVRDKIKEECMTEVNDELLPCPFCGGEPRHSKFRGNGFTLPRVEYSKVWCQSCSITTDAIQLLSNGDRALTRWNTRPAPDNAGLVEALASAYSKGCHDTHDAWMNNGHQLTHEPEFNEAAYDYAASAIE